MSDDIVALRGDAELLVRIGRALYGENFHNGLAAALGVNNASIRNWVHGRNGVPDGIWRDLAELARQRSQELTEVNAKLAERLQT